MVEVQRLGVMNKRGIEYYSDNHDEVPTSASNKSPTQPLKKRKLPSYMIKQPVWVRGEEDPNPIKLQVTDRTDVADLLVEASGSGEFNYFVKNTKSYNLLCNNEILPRSSMVADDTLKSTAENPFIIVKAKKQEPDYNQQLEKYLVRPSGEHSRAAFASLLEDIIDYHDFIEFIKRNSQLINTDNMNGSSHEIDFLNKIVVDGNELSLTAKLTSLQAIYIQDTGYYITPFYNLQVPEGRKGHPYMSDFLVYNSALAVSKKKQLVMLLEVKKQISSDICMIDHSNIIEMLLYVRYLISLNCLNALIGGLTDGHNAHCVRFILSSNNKLKMEKCGHMKDEINILQAMMYFNN